MHTIDIIGRQVAVGSGYFSARQEKRAPPFELPVVFEGMSAKHSRVQIIIACSLQNKIQLTRFIYYAFFVDREDDHFAIGKILAS